MLLDQNTPRVDVHNREHPIPYAKTVVIGVNSGQKSYDIPDYDFWRDKLILGVAMRKQNAGNTRYSKNGNLLIPDTWLGRGFLRLSQNNTQVVESLPLEMIAFEPGVNSPGEYAQLVMDGGFSASSSAIEFSGSAALPGGPFDVELIFFYVMKNAYCAQ